MDVKLLLVLLILQSATANYPRWHNLKVGRYIRSVDKNEPAVTGRTSDEVNGQQIDSQNSAIEADSGVTNKAEVMIKDNTKESDRSGGIDQSSGRDESQGIGNGLKPCYGENCTGNGNKPCYGKNCDQSDSPNGSDSDEGSPCKGKGCSRGGEGVHLPFQKCSIFPGMTACEKRDFTRMFDVFSMALLADDQVSTPIDYGFGIIDNILDAFVANYATPEVQMLRSVIRITLEGFRKILEIFRGFVKIALRIIEFLKNVGLIPASFVNLTESVFPERANYTTPEVQMLRSVIRITLEGFRKILEIFRGFAKIVLRIIQFLKSVGLIPASLFNLTDAVLPGLASGVEYRNPLLNRTEMNWVQQKDASCPTTEYINFFKITFLRTLLKKGLRIWLWLGTPRADVEKIRNMLIKFLKDEYGHEFNCPLDYTPYRCRLSDSLKDIFGAKLARSYALVTKKVLIWTQLDSTKFDTILDIINKFLETWKDEDIKWDKLNYNLEVKVDQFKVFLKRIIEWIFYPKPAKPAKPAETWIGNLGNLVSSLTNKLSPINFADILATLTCQIYGKTPTSLNILEAQSTIKSLQTIKPIGGITQPKNLVNLIAKNIPQQLNKFSASFAYLLDKIKSEYSTLFCGGVNNVALSISNDITTLESLLSGKPWSCLNKLEPKINDLNVYTNVGMARCVEKALDANGKIEDNFRTKVIDFRNDIVNYYDALKDITTDTIQAYIQSGDVLASRLDAYVRNAVDLDLSALKLDACVQQVKLEVAAGLEDTSIKEDISQCK